MALLLEHHERSIANAYSYPTEQKQRYHLAEKACLRPQTSISLGAPQYQSLRENKNPCLPIRGEVHENCRFLH